MSKEAMKLALEALRRSRKSVSGDLDLAGCAYGSNDPDGHRYDDAKKALTTLDKAITALKEALAQPEQEPANKYCCHFCFSKSGQMFLDRMIRCHECGNKRCPKATSHELPCTNSNEPNQAGSIYTTPPQRKPLTDEEIASIYMNHTDRPLHAQWNFARAIEAAHGIKE